MTPLERDQADDLVKRMTNGALVSLNSTPSPAARLRHRRITDEEYIRIKALLPHRIAEVINEAIEVR